MGLNKRALASVENAAASSWGWGLLTRLAGISCALYSSCLMLYI